MNNYIFKIPLGLVTKYGQTEVFMIHSESLEVLGNVIVFAESQKFFMAWGNEPWSSDDPKLLPSEYFSDVDIIFQNSHQNPVRVPYAGRGLKDKITSPTFDAVSFSNGIHRIHWLLRHDAQWIPFQCTQADLPFFQKILDAPRYCIIEE